MTSGIPPGRLSSGAMVKIITLRNYFPFYYNRQEAEKSRFAIFWWLYDKTDRYQLTTVGN